MDTEQKFLDQISSVVEKTNFLEIKLEMILYAVLRPATSDYGHVLEKALHNTVISLGGKLHLIRAILEYWSWNDLQKKMGTLDDVLRIRNAFAHTSVARRQFIVELNPQTGSQTKISNQMVVESKNGRKLERIERGAAFQRFNKAYDSSIALISEIEARVKQSIAQQAAVADR